jgi:hypothetical protein
MQNGRVCRLPQWVRLIRVGDCFLLLIGSQVLWEFSVMSATPQPCSRKRSSGANRTELMKTMIPTPTAADAKGHSKYSRGNPTLTSAMKMLHPTPTVAGNHNRKGCSKTNGDGLATFIKTLHPTPRADGQDNAGGTNSRRTAKARGVYFGRTLNPEYVEWLLGFPIGWTDLDVSETASCPK